MSNSEVPQTRNASAPSFTAAGFSTEPLPDAPDWQKPKHVKNKGKVVFDTNFGIIKADIHCDLVPILAENFMRLSEEHYYDGTLFHRVIPKFMMQGGDPSGTGNGGRSCWGVELKDEFCGMKHDSVGVISMANHGKDTNGSQFFITFKEQPHLDRVHSVIGKVTEGFGTLKKIESVEVDENDRPLKDVVLRDVSVEYNPFTNTEGETTKKQKEEEQKQKEEERKKDVRMWFTNPSGIAKNPLRDSKQIGKYLPAAIQERILPKKPTIE
ncbi:cyclophilin, putative [Entamoeba invadens IP1]|uniref:Peptidyl-prolyl cis-trans isomerase n=1 Tax=Entamoeba invadens IP1 TaxID=370355 RepID=A0A0A1UD97_ENTIV|nr:cyclophilin, putative [Entamoeba invadens IP1]ELP90293.1 cyclophilin, putative [Entamoeba invadens IP1]|eukprot:XP_004257064.1 cyclophilin, putative [Entamoeba invadens IP1]